MVPIPSTRFLPWLLLPIVVGLWLATSLASSLVPQPAAANPAPNLATARPPHYAGPSQLAASNAMIERTVDGLEAVDSDGRRRDWTQLGDGQPVVLIFIKRGCPCSIEFEPSFHAVARAYREVVRFVGVIDADPATARSYAIAQHVPYPVLADPGAAIMRRFNARSGGYVALVNRAGVIEAFWPGSSRDALADLGRRIARLTGQAERPIDVAAMPSALTAGCPFHL
jgi:hypothetical protein